MHQLPGDSRRMGLRVLGRPLAIHGNLLAAISISIFRKILGGQMRYSSNAEWTKIKPSKDIHHQGREFAEAICERLMEEYGPGTPGCEIRGHCKRTWVEKEEDRCGSKGEDFK